MLVVQYGYRDDRWLHRVDVQQEEQQEDGRRTACESLKLSGRERERERERKGQELDIRREEEGSRFIGRRTHDRGIQVIVIRLRSISPLYLLLLLGGTVGVVT